MTKTEEKSLKKVWAITYSDGFEFAGVVIEIYDDETLADLRAIELNELNQAKQEMPRYDSYSVEEFELNAKSEIS